MDKKPQRAMRSGKRTSVNNREFAVITYCFIGLFLCTMGYFAYFQIEKSEDFINNPYNSRQEKSFRQTEKFWRKQRRTKKGTKRAVIRTAVCFRILSAILQKITAVPALNPGQILICCVPIRFFWKKPWIKLRMRRVSGIM